MPEIAHKKAIRVLLLDEDLFTLDQLNQSLAEKGAGGAISQLDQSHSTLDGISRLATLGMMATGIVHEINTPLASADMIGAQMKEMLKAGILDLEQFTAMVDRLQLCVTRIRKIASGFKKLSRDAQEDPFQKVSVKAIIESTLGMCEHRLRLESVKLLLDSIPEELCINCRASEVEQVLLNLIDNACDAIDGFLDKWIRIGVVARGSFIEIRVTDCGPGIREEIAAKLFEPFFTTKETGKGTGLGLSLSKGLIEAHSGKIEIDRKAPHTSFCLTLPKA